MTNLQAKYTELAEQIRHNQATEAATLQKMEIDAASQQEQARHNKQTEALSASQLEEQIRHQKAQDTESMRHNKVSEAEITRHNQAMEKQARADNELKIALNKADNAVKLLTTRLNNASAKEIKQLEMDNNNAQKQLDRALTKWKQTCENALNLAKLKQSRDKVDQDIKESDARITNYAKQQLQAAAELAYKYDANWAATKTKALRELRAAGINEVASFDEAAKSNPLLSVLRPYVHNAANMATGGVGGFVVNYAKSGFKHPVKAMLQWSAPANLAEIGKNWYSAWEDLLSN